MPDNRFCAKCGQVVNQFGVQQMPVYQLPVQQPYYPPPKQSNTAIIVVLLVFAVIAILVIVALMPLSNTSGTAGSSNDEVIILVHSGYVSYSQGIFSTPEDGNKFVVYNVTVTNNKNSELTFSILSFELHTKGGLVYMPSYTAGTPLGGTPESLSAGSSYTFTLGYEIPESEGGSQIVYDWVFDHGSATVPV